MGIQQGEAAPELEQPCSYCFQTYKVVTIGVSSIQHALKGFREIP